MQNVIAELELGAWFRSVTTIEFARLALLFEFFQEDLTADLMMDIVVINKDSSSLPFDSTGLPVGNMLVK